MIACGEGRYAPARQNAAIHKANGIALNFQICGSGAEIELFEICVAWPDGWSPHFHLDPERESWPAHPRGHLQFGQAESAPPFADWRIPLGETDPVRLLEYLVTRITPA